MKLFNDFRNYLLEEELKINILKNKVNILNYTSIDHFDDSSVIIRHKEGSILVKGNNLVVSKLLDNEVLIEGKINQLELR